MNNEKTFKELELIKKLLILHLLKSGTTTGEIRNVLNMSGTAFKKLVPIKKIKKYKQV